MSTNKYYPVDMAAICQQKDVVKVLTYDLTFKLIKQQALNESHNGQALQRLSASYSDFLNNRLEPDFLESLAQKALAVLGNNRNEFNSQVSSLNDVTES